MVSTGGAFFIGLIAGILLVLSVEFFDKVAKVDDPAGAVSVSAWVAFTMTAIFKLIDMAVGLRVPAEVGIDGLGYHEHGLVSAYAGFSISDVSTGMEANENTDLGEDVYENASEKQRSASVSVSGANHLDSSTGMYKVSIIAKHSRYEALYTGHIGDGKIFVYNVQKVVKVRTGEEDLEALKDVE